MPCYVAYGISLHSIVTEWFDIIIRPTTLMIMWFQN